MQDLAKKLPVALTDLTINFYYNEKFTDRALQDVSAAPPAGVTEADRNFSRNFNNVVTYKQDGKIVTVAATLASTESVLIACITEELPTGIDKLIMNCENGTKFTDTLLQDLARALPASLTDRVGEALVQPEVHRFGAPGAETERAPPPTRGRTRIAARGSGRRPLSVPPSLPRSSSPPPSSPRLPGARCIKAIL